MSRFRRVARNYEELTQKHLVNAIAYEERADIRAATSKKANEFAQRSSTMYRMAGGMDPGSVKLAQQAADGVEVKDAGSDRFKRRKIFRGTRIMVQLVKNSSPGAVQALEFGSKNRPPTNAMRRTLAAMGGYLKVKGEGSVY